MPIKKPLLRPPRPDLIRPSSEDLVNLALLRIHHAVFPKNTELPPIIFPLAESMRWDFFTQDDWDEFGNLESEYGRLTYTLTRYPERGPPASCELILQELLGNSSLLGAWENAAPELETLAMEALNDVCRHQQSSRPRQEWLTKMDCVTVPADYVTSKKASTISLGLWRRSLEEVASQLATGCSPYAEQFLRVHAFLKDPIYGFQKPFKNQTRCFERLLKEFGRNIPMGSLGLGEFERLAAQAAQESAFLTNPLVDNVSLVHFHAHHQLTYTNVPLHTLARAEFSVPSHVLEVAEEMLLAAASNQGLACPIVPILVTARPRFSKKGQYLTPIIDGNHRATATLMLRFLANQPLLANCIAMSQRLLRYCTDHGLGKKWQIDLSDVLEELYADRCRQLRDRLTSQYPLVSKFATVRYIPALVVQEEDFHTICKQRSAGKSKPVLLHPFHQTLFNDDELPFALPQKAGQTHGRPEVFRLMSLTPFGTSDTFDKNVTFNVLVRESMNGLTGDAFTPVGQFPNKSRT